MAEVYNVYCDESCHLEHDGIPTMVIGAVWCPQASARELCQGIRAIKARHGLPTSFESKWTKVSPGKLPFYLDMVDFFFSRPELHFRGVLIPDKRLLDHARFNQEHDTWYYKMFFVLLKEIIDPTCAHRIYFDIKDTRSERKRGKLEEVLRNAQYDFAGQVVEKVQQIRSHESEILQLADLLIGAVCYHNRNLTSSNAKLGIIARIQDRSRKSLHRTTWPKEPKFNLLCWEAKPGGGQP
jgi:hypothetical protein